MTSFSLPWPMPWNDRAGRFSSLKAVTLALVLLPAIVIGWQFFTGTIGPRPYDAAIDKTGDFAVYIIIASLTITPARRILDLPKLILIRRMVGVSGFFYAAAHFTFYLVDQQWDIPKVAFAIALQFYITIGFIALLGLLALALTSTDGAIRALGKRWVTLHKGVYVIGVLIIFHYFLQSKLDVSQATLMAGLFLLLMTYRQMQSRGIGLGPLSLLMAAPVVALITIGLEYAWFELATPVDGLKVIAANLHPELMMRPAHWVLIAGVSVAAIGWLRRRDPSEARGRRVARPA